MKNNVLIIFNNQRNFDTHKRIVKNRIELIKKQFGAFGIKFHEVNLSKFNFINNFQIGKLLTY